MKCILCDHEDRILQGHLLFEHDPEDVARALDILLGRIYENLDVWTRLHLDFHRKNTPFLESEIRERDIVIHVLKSLLEK